MSSLCVIVVNETVAKHIHDYNHCKVQRTSSYHRLLLYIQVTEHLVIMWVHTSVQWSSHLKGSSNQQKDSRCQIAHKSSWWRPMAARMKTTARKCKLMTVSLDRFWMPNVKIVLHTVAFIDCSGTQMLVH